jgi:cellulose synthase/poly-beta-1,6-N-acetylglucosamine synthase-like glycosyltransferase
MSRFSNPASLATAADGARLSDAGGHLTVRDLPERFESRIAIVIPAYGEAENLSKLLPRVPTHIGGVPAAVLVVDDGSKDDTPDAALRAGAVLARLPENRGGGAALRAGYALMVGAGAGVVVTMDADGQHRPEELASLVAPVLSGRVQLVQGSRVLGSAESGAFARELGVAFFSRLVRILTGVRVTDCSNSFRAMQTEILPKLDLRQPQFHAAELLIEAISRSVSYEEVPVNVLRRQHGRSKKPATLRYGFGFSLAIISAWTRSVIRRGTIRRSVRAAETSGAEGRAGERAAKPLRLAVGRSPAPIESPQRQCEHGSGGEISNLEAQQLVAHRPQQQPDGE